MPRVPECSFLEKLPPEVRLNIYEYVLRYDGVLQRPSLGNESQRIELGLLWSSRRIYDEAIDVLYDLNTFRINYNWICNCFPEIAPYTTRNAGHFELIRRPKVPPFDAARICKLHITAYGFLDPNAGDGDECTTCQRAGLGLVEFLVGLPRLRSVTIDFDLVFGLNQFAERLRQEQCYHHRMWDLAGAEVGLLNLTGTTKHIQLSVPALTRAWRTVAGVAGIPGEGEQLMGEEAIRHAMEYVIFEGECAGRVPRTLTPFFEGTQNVVPELRLKSAANATKRLADFSIALTEVLSDIFLENGGSESIDWVHIGSGVGSVTWTCTEGVKDDTIAAPSTPPCS